MQHKKLEAYHLLVAIIHHTNPSPFDPWVNYKDLISPYSITPKSHIKFMRIKQMITN